MLVRTRLLDLATSALWTPTGLALAVFMRFTGVRYTVSVAVAERLVAAGIVAGVLVGVMIPLLAWLILRRRGHRSRLILGLTELHDAVRVALCWVFAALGLLGGVAML